MADTAAEVQVLLRFLTKDARLPLPQAMPIIHPLRKLNLNTPEKIFQAEAADMKTVFTDDKILKQVSLAARRVVKPRKSVAPQRRTTPASRDSQAGDDEESTALPETEKAEDELKTITIETNRAPLFLAFTVSVLSFTHPEQPISSRLSIAQAVVSAGAQSKAKSIGLSSGPTAEEDGWAMGQPKLRVMGRQVAVMRRQTLPPLQVDDDHTAVKAEQDVTAAHDAFWGLDLEALKKSNGPLIADKHGRGQTGPPIHTAEGARNYLLRSMNIVSGTQLEPLPEKKSPKAKRPVASDVARKKEEAAAVVLKAISIVCESWKNTLTPDELDRRAQTWYALSRPEVAQGPSGWGQRGQIHLADILRLKREP